MPLQSSRGGAEPKLRLSPGARERLRYPTCRARLEQAADFVQQRATWFKRKSRLQLAAKRLAPRIGGDG